MEFSKGDMKILKGIAIIFMLLLHLFCRKDINGLYETFPMVNGVPLIYYLALFGDACVPIYCFASGYGLFVTHNRQAPMPFTKNVIRILKLLVNYWIILLLFIAVALFINQTDVIPGSPGKFLLNFFVLSYSYNGVWWFLQTYVILVFLSPVIVKLLKKYNIIYVLLASGIIYFISYVQRIKHVFDFGDYEALSMFINSVVLFGTSLLPFIAGAVFAKEQFYTKIHNKLNGVAFKNMLCIFGILLLILIHSVIESMFIAPFTAIAFICFFNLLDKGIWLRKPLELFGEHSTNIWLTHMFFYLILFPELTFSPKYPLFIFIWLIIMCFSTSFIVNSMYKPVLQWIERKQTKVVDMFFIKN